MAILAVMNNMTAKMSNNILSKRCHLVNGLTGRRWPGSPLRSVHASNFDPRVLSIIIQGRSNLNDDEWLKGVICFVLSISLAVDISVFRRAASTPPQLRHPSSLNYCMY